MQEFETLIEKAKKVLDDRTAARDQALTQARQLTRLSAHTIRAIHRDDTAQAEELLTEARIFTLNIQRDLASFPDLYYAGYTQDAIKEFAEASLTCAYHQYPSCPHQKTWGSNMPLTSTDWRRPLASCGANAWISCAWVTRKMLNAC